MKTNIFIPEKINVGFQERNSTYTGKLAYVIYFDEKGKLRKETSWNSWRNKDLGNEIFENVPTSGFVLNKKAGGYSTGWNHRQTYVRVYDPRNFEFEITVPNLLYILENATSTKGKGLEGEFVYGWDGKDLVLIPTESPDYKEITEFNERVHSQFKLKGKDLKLGATYLTKDNEEWIYLGKFDKWGSDYDNKYLDENGYTRYPDVTKGKAYFFKHNANYGDGIEPIKSLNKFIGVVSEECVENYAELIDKLERNTYYSPIDHSKDEYLSYNFEEFEKKFEKDSWYVNFYSSDSEAIEIRRDTYGNSTENLQVKKKVEYQRQDYWSNRTYTDYRWDYIDIGNVKDIFDKYKPHYLNIYLKNGKLYSEGK
jgi:hypothetical protein